MKKTFFDKYIDVFIYGAFSIIGFFMIWFSASQARGCIDEWKQNVRNWEVKQAECMENHKKKGMNICESMLWCEYKSGETYPGNRTKFCPNADHGTSLGDIF